MTTLIKSIRFVATFLLLVNVAFAQEGTRALQYNSRQLFHKYKPSASLQTTRAELPFIDDFSTTQVVPDQTKWIDSYVYINSTCPVNPPTIGVATFDGLNSDGTPYNPFGGSSAPQPADVLTSVPINLSAHTADNNVYFSFLFQPQGLCNKPEAGDSLVLEFTGDSVWFNMWSTPGFASLPSVTG